jgi:hypothetical protein
MGTLPAFGRLTFLMFFVRGASDTPADKFSSTDAVSSKDTRIGGV